MTVVERGQGDAVSATPGEYLFHALHADVALSHRITRERFLEREDDGFENTSV